MTLKTYKVMVSGDAPVDVKAEQFDVEPGSTKFYIGGRLIAAVVTSATVLIVEYEPTSGS